LLAADVIRELDLRLAVSDVCAVIDALKRLGALE
jgi:hypothetical protein